MTNYKTITKIQKTASDDGFTLGTWYYITYKKSGKSRKCIKLPKEAEKQIMKRILNRETVKTIKCKGNITYITTTYC